MTQNSEGLSKSDGVLSSRSRQHCGKATDCSAVEHKTAQKSQIATRAGRPSKSRGVAAWSFKSYGFALSDICAPVLLASMTARLCVVGACAEPAGPSLPSEEISSLEAVPGYLRGFL